MNIAVLGAAWGDEGKGHIVHYLSPQYDWVVRFSGGANAGHTIYRDGVKYVHNLLPSFDWRSENSKAFLGSGMVIDLVQLHLEVSKLASINVSLPNRVYIDPDAFTVLEEHIQEDKELNTHIGSTNRGIGPAYKAKFARQGVRIRDILNGKEVDTWNNLAISKLKELGVQFKTVLELKHHFEKDNILFEGAQGIMLDINHGIYPYVSCGDATVAGIYSCGFHFARPEKVYGVAKCYTTKVGEGPFPTELSKDEAEDLRKRGGEYGATTGRPRRIGWIDVPALNYACQKGGITNLVLTKFDILNGMDRVPMCVAYDKPPVSSSDFYNAKPQYITVPGWSDAKTSYQLNPFIDQVEKSVGCEVSYISCGTGTEDIKSW